MNFNQDDVYTKNKSMVKIIEIQPTKTKDWNGRFIPSNDIIVDVDGSILIFSEEKLTEMLTLNNYVCGLNDFFKNKEKLIKQLPETIYSNDGFEAIISFDKKQDKVYVRLYHYSDIEECLFLSFSIDGFTKEKIFTNENLARLEQIINGTNVIGMYKNGRVLSDGLYESGDDKRPKFWKMNICETVKTHSNSVYSKGNINDIILNNKIESKIYDCVYSAKIINLKINGQKEYEIKQGQTGEITVEFTLTDVNNDDVSCKYRRDYKVDDKFKFNEILEKEMLLGIISQHVTNDNVQKNKVGDKVIDKNNQYVAEIIGLSEYEIKIKITNLKTDKVLEEKDFVLNEDFNLNDIFKKFCLVEVGNTYINKNNNKEVKIIQIDNDKILVSFSDVNKCIQSLNTIILEGGIGGSGWRSFNNPNPVSFYWFKKEEFNLEDASNFNYQGHSFYVDNVYKLSDRIIKIMGIEYSSKNRDFDNVVYKVLVSANYPEKQFYHRKQLDEVLKYGKAQDITKFLNTD